MIALKHDPSFSRRISVDAWPLYVRGLILQLGGAKKKYLGGTDGQYFLQGGAFPCFQWLGSAVARENRFGIQWDPGNVVAIAAGGFAHVRVQRFFADWLARYWGARGSRLPFQ